MGSSAFYYMVEGHYTPKEAYNAAVRDDCSDNGRGNSYSGGPQTTSGFLEMNHLIIKEKFARDEALRLMGDDALMNSMDIVKRGKAGMVKAKGRNGSDVWCVFGWGAE